MAAKGSIFKQEIAKKILEVFPDSFLYNDGKEVRINGEESGNPVQIKITMTCAKTPVENDSLIFDKETEDIVENKIQENTPQEPTEEEKERLKFLLDKLGL